MLKVLVPVDESTNALGAVRHAIAEYQRHYKLELHLLNVQPRLSRYITRFVSRHNRDSWHHDQALTALAGARAVLEQGSVPYLTHWAVGERVAEICGAAQRLGVHHIVMGTARQNFVTRMLEASVTSQVLEATPVPVEIIVGTAVSKWERRGLPAGVLAVGGCWYWRLTESAPVRRRISSWSFAARGSRRLDPWKLHRAAQACG